jgi:hypothetical protein
MLPSKSFVIHQFSFHSRLYSLDSMSNLPHSWTRKYGKSQAFTMGEDWFAFYDFISICNA